MPEQFQDHEFNVPYTLLTKKGYTVNVAGLKPGVAVGAFGLKVTPTCVLDSLTNADLDRYDAVVIPGGPGSTKYLWNNQRLQEVVKYFHEHKKVVAAICYACIVPVQAGILTGKRATVFPTTESKAVFKQHDVTFVDQGVVTLKDERVITAQGPTFAQPFGQAIIDVLGK
jgi:protease I